QETVLDFLACGIDAKKSIVFIQSQIKEHAELANLLQNITPIGELQRMTQFKDKSKKEKTVGAGLLMYPVLQAADILLYETDVVPIGEDQKQHLELAKNIVRRFNNRFGKTFKEPKVKSVENGSRIMNLNKPMKKMSKSEPRGCIFLNDEPQIIEEKIKAAVTDSEKKIYFDRQKRPAVSNLLNIYSLCHNAPAKNMPEYEKTGSANLKKDLTEVLIKKLKPIREKRKELEKKPAYIKQLLEEGRKRADKIAKETMKEVKQKMGLI
ncbi:MAG: tryptophan--tRNA ligase, partial [Pseudomonadota bacterium]|nr:tryptophan--tRNA ligase [Pseudomonadota bacterium]